MRRDDERYEFDFEDRERSFHYWLGFAVGGAISVLLGVAMKVLL